MFPRGPNIVVYHSLTLLPIDIAGFQLVAMYKKQKDSHKTEFIELLAYLDNITSEA